MVIDLDGPIEPPSLPAGITLRGFDPERDDRTVHAIVAEAFAEGWSFVPDPFTVWRERHLNRLDADPTLWHLAVERDTVVGCTVCSPFPGGGFIDALAVRQPWRRRGIGLGLLGATFLTVSKRGDSRVALGVDSENEADATRLYERTGMRVLFSFLRFERSLGASDDGGTNGSS